MAMNTHRQLGIAQTRGAKSMEKLSSGFRINRAGDDAAGLAISEKMRGQIRGLNQASRNAQDGISLIQTAEGALNETHAILQRMRELTVQSANDTNTDADRTQIQAEIDQLTDEIDRIANTTQFNTINLLDGSNEGIVRPRDASITLNNNSNVNFQITGLDRSDLSGITGAGSVTITMTGSGGNQTLNVTSQGSELTFSGISADSSTITIVDGDNTIEVDLGKNLSGMRAGESVTLVVAGGHEGEYNPSGSIYLQIGANTGQNMFVSISSMKADDLGLRDDDGKAINIQEITGYSGKAIGAISMVDGAIQQVSAQRAELGAIQNRLEYTIANLNTSSENLQAAESRIRDVDMANEMMEFTKQNILQQASTAMLAQANMAPQSVLQLLG